MREPDKFAVLVALAYAYGFGWGIAWLTTGSRQKAAQIASAALAIALPLAYTPNLLGGLGGQVRASELPSSWSFASRLAGPRHRAVPALARVLPDPVHRPAGDRQPGGLLLRRNRPHQPESRRLVTPSLPRTPSTSSSTTCSARQWTRNGLRVALADLGVRFVALAKVADWRDFAGVEDAPGIRWCTRAHRSTSSLSGRPPARRATTAGCAPLTSSTTGSFPAVQALSPSPFPTRKAGQSTAIRLIRLADGQVGVLAPARAVSSFGPSSGVLASEMGRSRPLLLSQASRSSSGEGGPNAVRTRTRILARRCR